MLESISMKPLRTDVFRLASQLHNADFLRKQGFDDESVTEFLNLLASRGISDKLEDLCDGPFRLKPQLRKAQIRSRFSDGSFPVFYSSLEPETAKVEMQHRFLKDVSKPTKPRTAYYFRFSCNFDGSIKDVRPRLVDWPDLTHDSEYGFCNRLGAEAVATGLDGLLTPSARWPHGTNLPAFKRPAVSNPVVHALVSMTLDPSSGEVTVSERAVESP